MRYLAGYLFSNGSVGGEMFFVLYFQIFCKFEIFPKKKLKEECVKRVK